MEGGGQWIKNRPNMNRFGVIYVIDFLIYICGNELKNSPISNGVVAEMVVGYPRDEESR